MKRYANLLFISLIFVSALSGPVAGRGPQPGDLYREFATHNAGDRDWRITDDQAVRKFERARAHLPNARVEIRIDDLEHAIRAEAMLDRWGGHRGTVNKRIRFNDNPWIRVPELENIPAGIRPEQLFFQDNPIVDVPLNDLSEGINVFEADCDEEGGFGWGQWGLYSMVVRVYYDKELKGESHQIRGQITRPAPGESLSENPRVELTAEASMGVARIDVLASYDGYDEDGDGAYHGFHESHFQLVRGEPNEIRDHVGTLWKKPYGLIWNTDWVPDQAPDSIALIARIQDSRGYWYVTDPVAQLSLDRPGVSVKLYRASDVPEDFGVRAGQTKSCVIAIPQSDPLDSATQAVIHLRSWHGWDGHHEPLRLNDHELAIDGKNHFYDYDRLPLPTTALQHGTNTFTIRSETEHHMLEVLWPGPAIAVRYIRPLVTLGEDDYEGRDHFVIKTPRATYWLDKKSGGLSRLIDRDANDWIAFKKEPWDRYPDSAASAYRGLPNLLFGSEESGFGHPGWDLGQSEQVDEQTIVTTSTSGKWRLRWEFKPTHAVLHVQTDDPERRYWFLYEGPIAGRWAPGEQYVGTDLMPPQSEPHDYASGDRVFGHFKWAYLGDRSTPRVLALVHQTPDQEIDTFAHLGNTRDGLQSPDGMIVFGFGRGRHGIEPLLKGHHSFRIGLIESAGETEAQYRVLSNQLESW